MNMEEKLNKNMEKSLEIKRELKKIYKEIKKYERDKKRAKNETAKDAIERQNIQPLKKQVSELKKENKKLYIDLAVIESTVLREELNDRDNQNNNTVTNLDLDNNWRIKLKFLFSHMRRFGNFTGYIAGRLDETNYIINNEAVFRLITERINYIKSNGQLKDYCEKIGINENDKNLNKYLEEYFINELTDEQVNNETKKIRENALQGATSQKSDRGTMIKRLINSKNSKIPPETPYINSYITSHSEKDNSEER